MQNTMKRDRSWLLKEKYNGVKTRQYYEDCLRLVVGEPLAYVIGWIPFLELRITLKSHPLIPRPETEWWTEKLLSFLAHKNTARKNSKSSGTKMDFITKKTLASKSKILQTLSFLDLCAGSGAIGCAVLAKYPKLKVTFTDIDKNHTETIHENISVNNLNQKNVRVLTGDLFNAVQGETFDIIVTNPPYIPKKRALPDSVARYEPMLALRAGLDGLTIIRRIAREAKKYLKLGGSLWMEVDALHASKVLTLLRREGANCTLHTDQYGRPRFIVAYWT